MAAVTAQARRATELRKATAARGVRAFNETCVICVGPVVAPVQLPCGHAYCKRCLAELQEKGMIKMVSYHHTQWIFTRDVAAE